MKAALTRGQRCFVSGVDGGLLAGFAARIVDGAELHIGAGCGGQRRRIQRGGGDSGCGRGAAGRGLLAGFAAGVVDGAELDIGGWCSC